MYCYGFPVCSGGSRDGELVRMPWGDTTEDHDYLSNEKNLGWLDYIGDEILPSYIGIVFSPLFLDPEKTIQDSMESRKVFFVAHLGGSGQLVSIVRLISYIVTPIYKP